MPGNTPTIFSTKIVRLSSLRLCGSSGIGKTSLRVTLPHSNSKLISGKQRNISKPKLTVGLPRAQSGRDKPLIWGGETPNLKTCEVCAGVRALGADLKIVL